MIKLLPFPQGEDWSTQLVIRWFVQLVYAVNNITDTGTTAQRPNPAPFVGFMYFDSTLNKPIWAKTTTQYVFADGTNA